MKTEFKVIVVSLLLGYSNFLFPQFTDAELLGAYQRANGELLFVSKEKGQVYMADPATNKKNRVYKFLENDEKVQFVGWDDGVTFFHDANMSVVGMYLLADESFYKKLEDFGLLKQPTMGIDLSLFEPDYAVYNLFVGCYENRIWGRVNILHTAHKLFLAFADESGNCVELLPHISNKLGTNSVNTFYFLGHKVIFEDDLKTMNVVSKKVKFTFTRQDSV